MMTRLLTLLGGLVLTVCVGLLFVWPLVWIWDFVMPDVFGLPEITYWQMFWLYCLIQILFKLNVTINNKK
jgi:hypothetical protein